jgi:MerR family transcriptional regulator/heat shock protein HspR
MTEQEQGRDPAFVIGVAARMVGLHAQTLRTYERLGLVAPVRPRGHRRLYSLDDIRRLREIKELLDLGVNLAGVEMILGMRDRIRRLEDALEAVEEELLRRRSGERPRLLTDTTPLYEEKR